MKSNQVCGPLSIGVAFLCGLVLTEAGYAEDLALGQGIIVGEVTSSSALLQTRLTLGSTLNSDGDLPGSGGVVRFELATDADFTDRFQTSAFTADADTDYVVRANATSLRPGTKYFYRAVFGVSQADENEGSIGSFRTLPGEASSDSVRFIVGSCMNYNKFMHGKRGNAGPVVTATDEDKRLGFPAFAAMAELEPDFFIGTGDIVYYDNPFRVAKTVEELRLCWHEQFRFPRMVEFFRKVRPTGRRTITTSDSMTLTTRRSACRFPRLGSPCFASNSQSFQSAMSTARLTERIA